MKLGTLASGLIGGLVGVALFAWVRWLDSPWKALPGDTVVVYLARSSCCVGCEDLLEAVLHGSRPELTSLVPIPVDGLDDELCEHARKRSRLTASHLLLPESIYCRWLEADAREHHAGAEGEMPLFFEGERPLSRARRERLLGLASAPR